MEQILKNLRDSQSKRQEQLEHYLRIASISSDPGQAQAVAQCAEWTAQLLRQAGLEQVRVHSTLGHPLVVGSWRRAVGQPTVLIYGHYDVQPVDPLALWEQEPFAPHYRDERIFARGATDDKGQVLMHIQAVAAILATTGCLPVNVVFLLEGEEEIGSPNLPAFIATHQQELAADLAVISDSSMWAMGRPAITVQLRGLVLLEVTVTGPKFDLHSGIFGGAVANPVEMLARLLATVKDDDGNVVIPGFYDQVREAPDWLRQQLAALPFDQETYLRNLGLTHTWGESGRSVLERVWLRPTFEINGLWGGYTGPGSKTVLPSLAHAKLSMRLVPEQDPDTMVALVADYLTAMAPPQIRIQIERVPGGGRASTVSRTLPALQAARLALQESFQQEPLLIGEGGTIPIVAEFATVLGIQTLLIGFGLPDANTHSPNENLHLPTFHTGTESLVRLLRHLGTNIDHS